MRNIESELERAGTEFRKAGQALPDRHWGKASSLWSPGGRLTVFAIAAAAVFLLAVPIAVFGGGGGPGTAGSVGGASETATPTGGDSGAASTARTLVDPPYLLLEAEGWEMVYYYESSQNAWPTERPLVFRPADAGLGEATFVVSVVDPSVGGWDVGERAERYELDGRVVSVASDSGNVNGDGALVVFEDGSLVVVRGAGMEHDAFVDAAKQVTVDPSGAPVVVPPDGFEVVPLPEPFTDTVIERQATYERPDGANVEVRVWSGTMADVELQVLNRVQNAQLVRPVTIDGTAAALAHDADSMSRFWIVGGADGYVIEIDFNPFLSGAAEADPDAVLSEIRFVDLPTFELALPEGAVTSATMNATIGEMLSDVPQPAGFDVSAINSTGSRYHVGAEVVGAVTCAWIEEWTDARNNGDLVAETEAADALLSSKSWAILLEMDTEGDYPEVVWQYADGIATDGTVVGGRVLSVEESYRQALGCNN